MNDVLTSAMEAARWLDGTLSTILPNVSVKLFSKDGYVEIIVMSRDLMVSRRWPLTQLGAFRGDVAIMMREDVMVALSSPQFAL